MTEPEVELEELASRYRSWDTEALRRATTVEASTYRPEALVLLRRELEGRPDAAAAEPPPVGGASERELRGVRGSLAWMVFAIGSQSAWMFVDGFFAHGHKLFDALMEGSIGFYGLLVCWMLLRIDQRAPRAATIFFVLTLLLSLNSITLSVIASHFQSYDFSPLTYPISWLSYLWRSERVRVTYSPAPPAISSPLPASAAPTSFGWSHLHDP
jgi:hypothetical protein